METVNHEYYVSLEVAKLLKQAGFYWETRHFYNPAGDFCEAGGSAWNWNGESETESSAPTLSVAQKWLREVKSVFLYVEPLSHTDYSITWIARKLNGFTTQEYATHEEAQEAGEKKALEMILEKGE